MRLVNFETEYFCYVNRKWRFKGEIVQESEIQRDTQGRRRRLVT